MLDRLGVLLLRERVHRPELLAAAGEPIEPGLEAFALLVVERLGCRRSLELELRGEATELLLGLGGAITGALKPDLGLREGLALGVQPRLKRGLLLRTAAEIRRDLLARLPVGRERGFELLVAGGDRLGQVGQYPDQRGQRPQSATRTPRSRSAAARSLPRARARSRSARSARSRSARSSAASWSLRPSFGPSSGAFRRRSITAAIRRSASAASSRAATRGAVRVRSPDRARARSSGTRRWPRRAPSWPRAPHGPPPRCARTSSSRRLRSASTRSSPDGRRLPQLPGGRGPHAAAAGDRDPLERVRDRVQRVEDPHIA